MSFGHVREARPYPEAATSNCSDLRGVDHGCYGWAADPAVFMTKA